MKTKFKGVAVRSDSINMREMHLDMQRLRKDHEPNVSLKNYLAATWGDEMTPEKFYRELNIDMSRMTVEKMLNTSDLTRWLFPEVFRDAIIRGIEYTPFFGKLITGEENIESTGLTMPFMDWSNVDRDEVRLRDTNEGATITEGEIVTFGEKQVTIKKKARGLKQTYESIMFTPLDLAAIYFEELGTQLGADLDSDLINIAFNGDQADGTESAPVIGAATANTLTYLDIARAWVRFKRLNRTSTAMLASEADALTLLNMAEFQRTRIPNGITPSGVTLNIDYPLPTTQDIYTHPDIPSGKIVLVDKRRFAVQLTAMPLLVESERIVARQITGEYVSIITGFANLFKDGRMVLDYTTTLVTNPGLAAPVR